MNGMHLVLSMQKSYQGKKMKKLFSVILAVAIGSSISATLVAMSVSELAMLKLTCGCKELSGKVNVDENGMVDLYGIKKTMIEHFNDAAQNDNSPSALVDIIGMRKNKFVILGNAKETLQSPQTNVTQAVLDQIRRNKWVFTDAYNFDREGKRIAGLLVGTTKLKRIRTLRDSIVADFSYSHNWIKGATRPLEGDAAAQDTINEAILSKFSRSTSINEVILGKLSGSSSQ
jgi:hypothetical protein